MFPFGSYIQRCPRCGHTSRRNVLKRRVTESKIVSREFRIWAPGSHGPISAPSSALIESYEFVHECRACGHRWTTVKTEKELLN